MKPFFQRLSCKLGLHSLYGSTPTSQVTWAGFCCFRCGTTILIEHDLIIRPKRLTWKWVFLNRN